MKTSSGNVQLLAQSFAVYGAEVFLEPATLRNALCHIRAMYFSMLLTCVATWFSKKRLTMVLSR